MKYLILVSFICLSLFRNAFAATEGSSNAHSAAFSFGVAVEKIYHRADVIHQLEMKTARDFAMASVPMMRFDPQTLANAACGADYNKFAANHRIQSKAGDLRNQLKDSSMINRVDAVIQTTSERMQTSVKAWLDCRMKLNRKDKTDADLEREIRELENQLNR